MDKWIIFFFTSFFLLGCGYTKLPKMVDPPKLTGNHFQVYPTFYPIAIYQDSADVPEQYIVVDSLCSVSASFVKNDASTALDLLIRTAIQIDADGITNIHYSVTGDTNQPPAPPLPKGRAWCDWGGPPPSRIATGTFIKTINNIPVFGDNEKLIFVLPCCPSFDITIRILNDKEIMKINGISRPESIINTDTLPAGIYSASFNAFEPYGSNGYSILWKTTRWFEIQK